MTGREYTPHRCGSCQSRGRPAAARSANRLSAPAGWAAPTSPNRARSLRARAHSSVSGTPPVVSGGSDASNSAHETFSDSDNFDLDRITVRDTGVLVGAGFAPAAARLHPEDRGRDAGALVFECRFAGAVANSVEQKVSDL